MFPTKLFCEKLFEVSHYLYGYTFKESNSAIFILPPFLIGVGKITPILKGLYRPGQQTEVTKLVLVSENTDKHTVLVHLIMAIVLVFN